MGQAILPAVLLHGTFDFALFLLSVLDFIHRDLNDESPTKAPVDPDASEDVEMPSLLSLIISFGLVFLGLAYYFVASQQQRERLNALDAAHDSSLSLALT